MGVDTTVAVGVGFAIPEDILEAYRLGPLDGEDLGDDEVLEKLVGGHRELLTWGTGGSYYDSTPDTHWVAVKRLTQSHNTDELPGGVVGLERPVITLDERSAINSIATKLGISEPLIGQFLSVLWW